jgi:hypothetical protein
VSNEGKWQRLNQSDVVLKGSVLLGAVGAVVSLLLGQPGAAVWLAAVAISSAFALARKRRSAEGGPVKHRSGRLTRF